MQKNIVILQSTGTWKKAIFSPKKIQGSCKFQHKKYTPVTPPPPIDELRQFYENILAWPTISVDKESEKD